MSEENSWATPPFADLGKEGQSLLTRGGFDRLLPPLGQSFDLSRPELEFQPLPLREALDKTRIPLPRPPAKAMFKMADDEAAIA